MGEHTNISWSDATWNTIVGCSKVSEGCRHCYAETLALRFGWTPHEWAAPYAKENVTLKPQKLNLPLKWKEPKMIFVNSLSDVFHEVVPFEFVSRMFSVMAETPRHTYQILTKRPERMRQYINAVGNCWRDGGTVDFALPHITEWPLPNVWLGTSVEDQRAADERIPQLLDTPAAVRFLSCEPLLGPLDLRPYLWEAAGPEWAGENPSPDLGWVIVGGESGSHLTSADQDDRWMDPAWARGIRDQCVAAGVPFFMKQHSGKRPGQMPYIIEADHSQTEWHQFPEGVTT
jgi:protein gp37